MPLRQAPAESAGGAGRPTDAAAIVAAFRSRIGADRFDVWFADALHFDVEQTATGAVSITVAAGSPFTHDWLQRTFRADLTAAAQAACGKPVQSLIWVPSGGVPPATAPAARPESVAPLLAGAGIGQGGNRSTAKGGRPAKKTVSPAGTAIAASTGGGIVPAENSPRPESGDRAAESATTAIAMRLAGPDDGRPAAVVAAAVPSRPTGGGRLPLTLEDYVVGAGNRMAHAAAILAADDPGAMSPLVIHGPGGTGKTHLLEGIGRRFRDRQPRAATLMLSAEQFTTTFLESLHGRRGLPGFRRTLRSADLLVIDDIQFLIGKKATVSELLHTLDALHRAGKQVVFGADRDVEALAELGADLQTRLRGGMSARLLPPDEPTRVGIVESLAARRGLELPADVVQFVASRMTRNSRELAGAVNRLEATSHMLGIPVTLGMAGECLADLVRSNCRAVRLPDIERAVCAAFGVDAGSLQSSSRARRVNHPRMLAMFLARKHTPAALAEIGTFFGRRSHSTVISAQRTVDGWIAAGDRVTLADTDWGILEAIRRVEEALRAG